MAHLKVGFAFILCLIFTSCHNFSEVIIGEISGVSINGFEEDALLISLKLPVENPTLHKITVTEFDSKIYMNNQYLGKLNNREPLVIKAKSEEMHSVMLELHFSNFFGVAMNLMNMPKGQKVLIKLEGEVVARSLLIRKTFPISESQEVIF